MLPWMDRSRISPCCRRSSGTSPMPASIAAVGDPLRSFFPFTVTEPASARSMPKMAWATSLRPAPTSPARAMISPAWTSNDTSVNTPSLVRRSTCSTALPRSARSLGKSASMSRPTIARMIDAVVSSSIGFVRTCRPSRMTVTRWQSAKISSRRCDTNSTAAPCVAQRARDAEEPLDLGARQRRGRLVHDDHARVPGERLCDLDELLVGDGQPARRAVGIHPHAEPVEERCGLAAHPAAVDAMAGLQRLGADEDVLGDAQVREERRLLEDDRDPGLLGLPGVVEDRLDLADQQAAAVGAVHAGDDLDERRLAGSVLADESVHLAGEELDGAVLECVDGPEALGRVLEDEHGLGGLSRAHSRWKTSSSTSSPSSGRRPSRSWKNSPISACQRALTSVSSMPRCAASKSSVSR